MLSKLYKYFYWKVWKKLHLTVFSNMFFDFIVNLLITYFFTVEWKSKIIVRSHIFTLNVQNAASSFSKFLKKNKEKNKLLTKIYQKPRNWRIFLDPTSAHNKSLTNSMLFSQVLPLKKDLPGTSELNKYLDEVPKKFSIGSVKQNIRSKQENLY